MLFNSYTFILLFLPATVAIFNGLRRLGWNRGAFAALTLASLMFYGWWSVRYLVLLIGLMIVNFAVARCLIRWQRSRRRGLALVLAAGVGFNLAVLGYFKYANFFMDNVAEVFGVGGTLSTIVLPLGISFFTFQKIALLVDCYGGKGDYLYIPLGGNRKGRPRRYVNLLLTMLLGGFWHGAGWTFVIWGGLHGCYLAINHAWRALAGGGRGTLAGRVAGTGLTFGAVVFGWVLFRSSDLAAAATMLRGMLGFGGFSPDGIVDAARAGALIVPLLGVVWLASNTQELTGYAPPGSPEAPALAPLELPWATALGGVFALAFLSLSKVSEFLYFQF